MVRPETKPDDVHGMLAAEGILLEDTKDGVRWKSVPILKKPG